MFLAFLGLALVTRSPMLRSMVEPRLAERLGGDVAAGRMSIDFSGDLRIADLAVRAPGVDGPGGDIFSAKEVSVALDLTSLVGFLTRGAELRVTGVRITEPTLRVSQDRDTGVFNIQELLQKGAAPGAPGAPLPRRLPEMRIVRGTLIFGEHTTDRASELVSMEVSGRLYAPDPTRPQYAVRLDQTDPRVGVKPMQLTGGVDLANASVWVDMLNLDLGRWRGASAEWRARALWRQLSIEGQVSRATFRAAPDIGYLAEFEVKGVNLDAPIPSEPDLDYGPVYPFMRLREVDGTIRFDPAGFHVDLAGSVEDLPGRIRLDTQGVSLDAALRCEITTERTRLSDRPLILPFAPQHVRTLFHDFSGPTAEITGRVLLTRGAPRGGVADEIRSEGEVTFANGRCAYARFPYPGAQMGGTVRFTDDRVDIVKVTGVGPSGAKIFAEGWFLTSKGDPVEVSVTVADVPVDGHLVQALGERGPVVDAICNTEGHRRLVEAGVIQSSASRAEAQSALRAAQVELQNMPDGAPPERRAELFKRVRDAEARAAVPVFDLGGLANVHIHVKREREGEYQTIVDVDFAWLGAVLRVFPLPLNAPGAKISIVDDFVTVRVPTLAGVTGGAGEAEATLRLIEDSAEVTAPRATAGMRDVPIDSALLMALPEVDQEPGAIGVRDALKRLGVSGRLDARVELAGADADTLGYEARAELRDGALAPLDETGAPGERIVEGLAGPVTVEGDAWQVGPLLGEIGPGAVEVSARGKGGAFRLTAALRDADLARPLERVAGALDSARGAALAGLRARHRPEGRFDAKVDIASAPGDPLRARAVIERLSAAGFDALSGRVGVESGAGSIVVHPGGVSFDGLGAELRFDGVEAGRLTLNGSVEPSHVAPGLIVQLSDAEVGSPLVRTIVRERLGGAGAELFERHQPRGRFDMQALLVEKPDGAMLTSALLRPRSLSVQGAGRRVNIPEAAGVIELRSGGGSLRGLQLSAEDWSARADGGWTPREAVFSVSADSVGLPEDLLALMPGAVRAGVEAIGLRVSDRLDLRDGTLRIGGLSGPDGAAPSVDFAGAFRMEGGTLDVGLSVTDLDGDAWLTVSRAAGAAGADVRIELSADQLRVAGAMMTDGRAVVVADAAGVVRAPEFGATLYGGRIVGQAEARFEPDEGTSFGPGAFITVVPPRRGGVFGVSVQAVGVDLAKAIADLTDRPAPDRGHDDDRSLVEFDVSLTGETSRTGGLPSSLGGRGRVRVRGGEIVSLPLALPVIELSNLQAPMGDAIEYADADFYIEGTRCVFDKLVARSGSIEIRGEGSAGLPDLSLDLRLRTSGLVRLPFISDVVDAVKNELLTIRVTGTLRRPEFGTVQMPATRGLVRDLLRPAEPRRPVRPVASESVER